jgi:hypothetical protein
MCGKLFLKPMLHLGPQKQWSPKIPKNSGSTPTPCLDKAVLAQGGGGVQSLAHPKLLSCLNRGSGWEATPCHNMGANLYLHTCDCFSFLAEFRLKARIDS